MRRFTTLALVCATLPAALIAQAAARPMTFLDQQLMRQAGGTALSPDGTQMLYTLSVPDWSEGKRYTDIFLVTVAWGPASARQLTFTKGKNETSPQWSRDGQYVIFASDREGAATQLFAIRPDGGEAQRITSAKDGVSTFALTRDSTRLIFAAGKADEQQLWSLPMAGLGTVAATQLSKHATPVRNWQIARDSRSVLFLAPDSVDQANKERVTKKFDVRVRNEDLPLNHLWTLELTGGAVRRLTESSAFSVESFTLSPDGRWAGLRTLPNDRYARTVTESANAGDLSLLNLGSGAIERLTTNREIAESALSFSPDSKQIAFSASDDFVYFRANKVYVRAVEPGGVFTKRGGAFDGEVTVGWWSDDARTIYFNEGIRATNQVMALDLAADRVTQVTQVQGSVSASRDEVSGKLLVTYSDPRTPTVHFVVDRVAELATRERWRQVTDANPQVAGFQLGEESEICWTSADKKRACGVLVKPVGYQAGTRYPLIVSIHGGPQAADVLTFNGGYGSQVYAGDGYMVLKPNYRGSTNYGEAHKWGIVNDYFKKGYEDIMTGVDHLIAQGLVDGNRMGVLGWSAGGHWTNWIITHTTRFKAASSGAGTANWISMYAQSDMQTVRMHYLGNRLPYEDFEPYWKQSPIRYIAAAKTPTMVHVVDGDPRVPRPQSEELYMALRKLGVPTELFVYPGTTHGIPDPRNQLVKAVSEKAWMDKWIRGQGEFRWQAVLQTLEESEAAKPKAASPLP